MFKQTNLKEIKFLHNVVDNELSVSWFHCLWECRIDYKICHYDL